MPMKSHAKDLFARALELEGTEREEFLTAGAGIDPSVIDRLRVRLIK